ncbi:MAG: MgtC/SapB family protein [Actinomycetota bacterium]
MAAAALGGAIGLERELNDQPAGFRTHILVTLGAALFTIAGAYGPIFDETDSIRFDPTRVAAQVVTGIGFLGAGAILRRGVSIRGLTTAASIWVSAAIGLSVGLGYWIAGVITTAVALLSLLLLKPVERAVVRRSREGISKLIVNLEPKGRIGTVTDHLEEQGVRIRSIKVIGSEGSEREIVALIQLESAGAVGEIVADLSDIPGVADVDLSR